MSKPFSWVFLIASGAFFVFVVGLTGYRIEDARRLNAAAARDRLPALAQKAQSLGEVAGGYNTPRFKAGMRALFDEEPRLLLLSIHSQDSILYLVTRNRAFLREPSEVTSDWRGTPSYVVSKGYELLLSTSLGNGTQDTMDVLSVIMGREDLYPVVRDDLYLFLAFLLICGVIMLIVFSVQQEPVAGRAPAAAPERAAAPEPPSPSAGSTVPPEPVLAPPSPRQGPSWTQDVESRLSAELKRADANDRDLACAGVKIDGPFMGGGLPSIRAEIAGMLKAGIPARDQVFESGEDSYTVILPGSGVDAALRMFEDLRAKISSVTIEGRKRTVSVGVSARGGRPIGHSTLLEETATALAKASREGGNQVIGFRADASRFRESLAGSAR